MGQNLSLSEKFADTSKATLSPFDRENDIILGVIWASCFYAFGMIWNGERGINIFSILAALLLSTGWPVILLYFAMSSR
ncbi:45541b1f-861d-4ca6-b987-c6b56866da85 [Thermothielavioides terrestris]|uniref:45541b1f-861d-4ca6-b987-c6b56866da85 n=1 Tax=Thermothielavioides terrestris TaxID=2587410 RepID=A0A446BNZ6_9PEZI|nr:45541b1f-861d-4ca6-b987-c6b56866da85 [Thermothielavioides terrestris]